MTRLVLFTLLLSLTGCGHEKIMELPKDSSLKINEYEKKIEVKPLEAAETAAAEEPVKAKEKKKKKKLVKKKKVKMSHSTVHEPNIEDKEGFVARRPVVDPFRVGESTILNLSYFNIVAGQLSVNVKPFVEVDGEKAYHFEATAVSNSFFSRIYAVDDRASTYVSYENMTPFNLEITLKESKQLAETRTLFDWEKNKAHYWKKRVTKEHGEEESKVDWDIKAFSQNVVSAAYYLRTFTMKVGKKLAIRVADEGKNIVFTGEVIRREQIETDIGKFWTWVIRPKVEVDGVFTPVGEILVWLTDDDRKFMVRAESKIKIGSLVAKVKQIIPGGDGKMPVQKTE
jgi:hypothetical protein